MANTPVRRPDRIVRLWQDPESRAARLVRLGEAGDIALPHVIDLMTSPTRPWRFSQAEPAIDVAAGEVVISSMRPSAHSGHAAADCEIFGLVTAAGWMSQWLSGRDAITVRHVQPGTGWGALLTVSMHEMTPEFWAKGSISADQLATHLGTLLALAASEEDGRAQVERPQADAVLDRVRDAIRHRASEARLTAREVAAGLGISERTLHRVLSAHGETFAALLAGYRMDLAKRMLESPAFQKLSIGEIGQRAGFGDASYFVRAVMKALGTTPNKYRLQRLP